MSTPSETAATNAAENVAMKQEAWINWRTAQKSYRNRSGARMGMSPGLLRARQQYTVKNALTGTAIAAFIVGVYFYSIQAVKQETFEDVDEEARAMFAENRRVAGEAKDAAMAKAVATSPAAVVPEKLAAAPSTPTRRGVLSPVLEKVPGLLDPQRKTIVWGAPSVDAVGRLSDRRV
ncbi:unnamed protein product [Peniophora sp. CBMAI 1063]|nr:unnamed protein product [Peniophora sp. CBMAI 1063]